MDNFKFNLKILILVGFLYIFLTLNTELTAAGTAPAVQLQWPHNFTNTTSHYTNFTFNASDVDASDYLTNCTLYLYKNSAWEFNTTNTTHMYNDGTNNTINITIEDGSFLWKVGCYDNESLQGNSSYFNLTVDATAPIINLQAPINNTNSSSSYVNFTYNATDAQSNIDSCILWLQKAGVWELNSTDSSITETINQSINLTIEDSSMLWKVECNDTLNNRGNSTTYNVTVDATAPIINLQAPINNTNSSSSYVNFTYNATDASSAISSCNLWLQKSGVWQLNSTDPSITETINQTFNLTIEDSSVLWLIECNDTVNNKANSTAYNLTIDTTVPIESRGGGISHGRNKFTSIQTATPSQNIFEGVVNFYNPNIPLISLVFQLDKEKNIQQDNLKITVEKILKSYINQELEDVYSYLLVKSDLDNSYFDNIKLNFKIKKDYDNVEFYQLFDQENYKLPLTKIYEDDSHNYYQANTNSLGYFAILAEHKEISSPLTTGETIKKIPKLNLNKDIFVTLLILILLGLSFFYIKPRWQKL